jgi:23S rRNA pseudouridine1911/1915/1917 synthase
MNYIVDTEFKGKRIDKFVAGKTGLSRVAVQRLIENGKVLVNGKVIKDSYKVNCNDEILVEPEEVKESKLEAEEIPLDIVYEDSDIIVVNKQKGLVVHPGNRKSKWNISKCFNGPLQRFIIWYRWRDKTRDSA